MKLAVVDAAASDSFAFLAREKEVVRLGQETLRRGKLSPEVIERAAACMQRFRTAAEVSKVDKIVAVATASVREASNSDYSRPRERSQARRDRSFGRRTGSKSRQPCQQRAMSSES